MGKSVVKGLKCFSIEVIGIEGKSLKRINIG